MKYFYKHYLRLRNCSVHTERILKRYNFPRGPFTAFLSKQLLSHLAIIIICLALLEITNNTNSSNVYVLRACDFVIHLIFSRQFTIFIQCNAFIYSLAAVTRDSVLPLIGLLDR